MGIGFLFIFAGVLCTGLAAFGVPNPRRVSFGWLGVTLIGVGALLLQVLL